MTNTTPIGAYRGAGRPEATAAVERAVDLFAAEIGMDPAEVRRRNFIAPDKFPFQHPDRRHVRHRRLRGGAGQGAGGGRVRAAARRAGSAGAASGDPMQLGIGVSSYVEITARGRGRRRDRPRSRCTTTARPPSTPAARRTARGTHTAWAMLVQDELGIPMDQVTVIHGDTDLIPTGVGTYGSRSLQLGGSAVHKAAVEVKDGPARLPRSCSRPAEADMELDTEDRAVAGARRPGHRADLGPGAGHASGGSLVADVRFTRTAHVPVRRARRGGRGGHRDRQGED